MNDVSSTIRKFIVDNFLFGVDDAFDDATSFLDEGIIDSTGVLELVTFIETNYEIQVADEDLVPENFDSVSNLAAYILRHTTPLESAS